MNWTAALATIGSVLALAAAPAFGQVLAVTGPTGEARTLSMAALAALPHQSVTLNVHGQTAAYQGVAISTLTALVGAPQGEALKGPAFADVVIVKAADGYRIVLSLAETDPAIRSEAMIVADRKDGQPLDAHEGPLRLVVEGDKRPARSARSIQSVEVRALP